MHENYQNQAKDLRLSESNSTNELKKTKQVLSSNYDTNIESAAKSITKLPPLKKIRGDEAQLDKTVQTTANAMPQRKMSEQDKKIGQAQNSYIVRKVQNKQKIDKKKSLQQTFKPQILLRYQQYLSFLSLINISNNISITNQQFQKPYILHVAKGNNGVLVKNIFKANRPWWIIQDNDPTSSSINMHWYQLRQNLILQKFKSIPNTQQEFDKFDYYSEEVESEEKKGEENSQMQNSSQPRSNNQRSHSVVIKDLASLSVKRDFNLEKRSSSRTKTFNKSTDKISKLSPSIKNHTIKQLKQQVLQPQTNKKALENPKMWPTYFMFRKIFSGPDMKKIKKLKIIKQDGRINGKLLRSKVRGIQNRSNQIVMHNHLQNNWNLSNKKALFMNIRHYFQMKKVNPFDYIPMTFHVQKIGDKDYTNFLQQYQRRCQQIALDQKQKNNKKSQYKAAFKPKKRNAWLIKPGQNTNRGIGIEVVESLEEIKEIIMKDNVDDQGRPRTHIVQEYIMPFLYQKRKFDIRCYILITSVNGIQKGYWYQDGYIRTACKEFNMKNLANRMIHLTNDAVQKHCQDYGKFQPGNKLSFADFQRYLDTNYNNIENGPKLKFWQQAYPEMKKLATDAIRSVYTKINPNKKQFSFQIFGLDFLIDENFKVWLIQANTNPCLQLSSPLLGRIIPSMLQNTFKIAIDPIFPPPSLQQISKMSKKMPIPENCIENNKFQLVFDEVEEWNELKGLLTGGPDLKIYNIDEEEEEYFDQEKDNQ